MLTVPWELPKWVQCKTQPAHSGCFKELSINEVLWMVSLSKPTLKARLNVLEHQSSFGKLKLGILYEQPPLPYLCLPPQSNSLSYFPFPNY